MNAAARVTHPQANAIMLVTPYLSMLAIMKTSAET